MNEITMWLTNNGLSQEMILTLIILIPVTATLTNVFRYLIGLKGLGVYPALILALAYFLSGAKLGIFFTLIVIATTLLSHALLKKIRMHYIARLTTNYIILVLVLAGVLLLVNAIPFLQFGLNFSTLSPVSVALIATLSDFILKIYIKKDIATTIRSIAETIFIALLGWSIMKFAPISNFLFGNLWILAIIILINVLIGKSSSLRFTELFRFKQILERDSRNITK
ncbi:MAG TPA: 7TM domain-containing protein [Candidatus Dojkabacteria bacterium]|nr:7TM domain-containing protein [Candidatus Dojkabacteria bacterium]